MPRRRSAGRGSFVTRREGRSRKRVLAALAGSSRGAPGGNAVTVRCCLALQSSLCSSLPPPVVTGFCRTQTRWRCFGLLRKCVLVQLGGVLKSCLSRWESPVAPGGAQQLPASASVRGRRRPRSSRPAAQTQPSRRAALPQAREAVLCHPGNWLVQRDCYLGKWLRNGVELQMKTGSLEAA